MIRPFSIGLLVLSVFFFPALVTFLGMAAVALFMPAVTLLVGILMDLLYRGDAALPIGTIVALCCIAVGYVIRTFTRSHILDA